MHKGHDDRHLHGDERDDLQEGRALRRKLLALLEHWIDHSDSHTASYREWAQKAGESGEEEVAREIHLAIADFEGAAEHLKRAKAILAAKLVLKR